MRFFRIRQKSLLTTDKQPHVFYFKKKPVSLLEYREEEMKLARIKRTAKDTTFEKLFSRRLRAMQPQKQIQISLNIDIMSDGLKVEKVFGPFKTTMPRLSDDDVYKFLIYTALKNNFALLSAEYTTAIGGRIIVYDKQFFKKHKMGKLLLESHFLSRQNMIKQTGENTCVLDYIWSQRKVKRGFKTYTFDQEGTKNLCEELQDYATSYPFMNTDDIIDWSKYTYILTLLVFPRGLFNTRQQRTL